MDLSQAEYLRQPDPVYPGTPQLGIGDRLVCSPERLAIDPPEDSDYEGAHWRGQSKACSNSPIFHNIITVLPVELGVFEIHVVSKP